MQVAGLRSYSGNEVQTALKNSRIANRASYSTKSMKNAIKTTIASELTLAAGGGATFAAANYVSKSKPAQEFLVNAGKTIAKSSVGKFFGEPLKELAPHLKNAGTWAKALPGPAKAVLAIGAAITLSAISSLVTKHAYNQGKIDQNMIDKSNIRM